MGQRLKHLPAVWETWVQSLGREDPLEKEMATHSSILAWRIPWTEEPGGLYCPQGRKESDTTELLHFHFYFSTPVSDSYCMISRTVGLTEASVCSLQLEPYISHMCKKILFIIYNLQSLITTIFTNDEMLYYKKSPLVYPHFFSVISHSLFFFFFLNKGKITLSILWHLLDIYLGVPWWLSR